MSKVLIVEDDIMIAEQVQKFLEHAGMQVSHLDSGRGVCDFVKSQAPDLLILDIMLPEKNGIDCCKELRTFSDIPIIMLTAKVEEIDRIIGLGAGADDYVCKPFSGQELTLRVQAILRRTSRKPTSEPLSLSSENYTISYNEMNIELTHMEFLLFNLLFQRPGRIYSRQQIIDLAYDHLSDISDRTIDSHIKNIRKKLKALNLETDVINSVYGAGYRYLPAECK